MMETVLDGNGLYGSLMHYSMTIALVGSAFLLFIYFWYKGRLDMDEAPKFVMMQEEEDE